MNKHSIECAALLMKWKRLHEGEKCGHMFVDVIIRGGPRVNYEAIASSQRQCVGRVEVTTETRKAWREKTHEEYVWSRLTYTEMYEKCRVSRHCPVCGTGFKSGWIESEEALERTAKSADWDDIPF